MKDKIRYLRRHVCFFYIQPSPKQGTTLSPYYSEGGPDRQSETETERQREIKYKFVIYDGNSYACMLSFLLFFFYFLIQPSPKQWTTLSPCEGGTDKKRETGEGGETERCTNRQTDRHTETEKEKKSKDTHFNKETLSVG